MKRLFTLLAALLLTCGLSWAQTITWDASAQGYENGQAIESVDFDDYVSAIFDKGTNTNAPKYYTSGAAIRCYGGNYFTVSSDYAITEIVLSFATGEGTNAITTDVGTYENGTWTGSANEVTFTIGGTSGHRRIKTFAITYSTSGTPSPSITANNVEIDYDSTEGVIEFTVNNPTNDGQMSVSEEEDWISNAMVSGNMVVFSADENEGAERQGIITLTYTYGNNVVSKNVTVTQTANPNGPGSEENPYTVAQARAAIDAGTGTQGVYATGIVSEITTAYNSSYGNISFNMVDEEGDEVFLQAYRCGGNEAADVAVGDIAVVYGNLTKYGSTYEFGQGCELVSLTHPTPTGPYIHIPTSHNFSYNGETYQETIDQAGFYLPQFAAQFCDAQGNPVNGCDWLIVEVTEEVQQEDVWWVLHIDCDLNYGTARTAYLYVYDASDNSNSPVTSNVMTITQDGDPDAVNTIAEITEVGTAYVVRGTVVALNSRGFVIGDGTGYVYTYLNATPTQAVGNMVTVSGTTATYGQIIQFNNSATVAAATSSNYDGAPDATVIIEVPDYSQEYHLSDYLEFEGALTKDGNNYLISLGEAQIQVSYPNTEQADALTALIGKNVHVKGYFSGINSSSKFTVMLESVEEVASTEPTITLSPDSYAFEADGGETTFAITYENFEPIGATFTAHFCDAEGNFVEEPDWISVSIEEATTLAAIVTCDANENSEPRSIYLRVMYGNYNSNIVTITQAGYVVDYATVPFEYDGNGTGTLPDGFTVSGLGTYSSSPAMKFDGTGDYAILHFVGAPCTLSFDIKGNTFSGGTFKVQTSADGETYTDLATYTELGTTQNEEFNLGENVSYIKWIYTEKVNGNVALGNIKLEEISTEPAITIDPASYEVSADGGEEQLTIVCANFTPDATQGFIVMFCDAEGNAIDTPEWISADDVQYEYESGDCSVIINFEENETTESRTAYFMVMYGDYVSNLVTFTQLGNVAPFEPATYTLATSIVSGNTYIIVGLNGDDAYAMGYDKGNNRAAVGISIDGTTATVETSDVYEFVLTGLQEDGFYSIYDDRTPGYLYAGSSNANQLKTMEDLDINGEWEINFEETGIADIVASNSENRNVMQFNYSANNQLFSCYSSASQKPVYLYVKDGGNIIDVVDELIVEVPEENDIYIVHDGAVLTLTGEVPDTWDESHIIVEDGGELFHDAAVPATLKKDIVGYNGKGVTGYYLVAAPVYNPFASDYAYPIPAALLSSLGGVEFDLYMFDESAEKEWLNYKDESNPFNGNLHVGVGYLFSYNISKIAEFPGMTIPTSTNFTVKLQKTTGATFSGLNLVGNPYTATAFLADGRDFYVLNDDGDIVKSTKAKIEPVQGLFVVANNNNEDLIFTTTEPSKCAALNIDLSQNNALVDVASINFNKTNRLEKFQLNPNHTKIFFSEAGKDYASIDANSSDAMTLNFKAEYDGTYTINVNTENIEMGYLHLIDNMTGADIDLLANPSYSFEAKTTDYASRFRLVFSDNSSDNNENFAFFSNGNIIVNGEGTLQVIDITGRVISTEQVNGISSVNVNANGVYVLQLVNGSEVKTQKIVVK